MESKENSAPYRQIRNLGLVLASAVLCGCLAVFVMSYYWGPAGTYALHDVLLSPDVLPRLSYNVQGNQVKGADRMVFDRMQFRYLDMASGQWKVVEVPLKLYTEFYARVQGDTSLEESNEALGRRIDTSRASRLEIWVKSLGVGATEKRILQELSFFGDGFYRVALQGQTGGQWIYFEHPHIHKEAIEILGYGP